jgi:capsular exopolysaccharide synthesis family protein
VTVIDFVTLTRRAWRVLLLSVLLGCAVMAAVSATTTPVYEARSAGFVAAGRGVVAGSDDAIARANAYVPLISSQPVLDKIRANPRLDTGGQPLVGRLSASVVPGSTLIEVRATASSPATAVALANGALAALASVIDNLEVQASPTDRPSITVVPLETASTPSLPSLPNWKTNLAMGAAAGLLLGYVVVLFRRALDVRVRATDDVGQLIGAGLLGRVPKLPRRRDRSRGITPVDVLAMESIRQIRTGLRFSSVDREVRSIAVTSANASEGKSTISAALAKAVTESGQATLLIDGDLRRPSVSAVLGVDGAIGLSDVLSGQVAVDRALQASETPGLLVLPAGRIPPNPSEMLGSDAMRALVEELRKHYFIVVDVPPLLPVTDAALVGALVDGLVFVVASGRTRKPEIVASRRILDQVHGRVLGVVLNLVSTTDGDGGYYRYNRKSRAYYAPAYDLSKKKGRRRAPSRRRAGRTTRQQTPQVAS